MEETSRRRWRLKLLALSAFALKTATAGLAFTNPSLENITAGVPFNLTWSGQTGTTKLTLQNGTASSINDVNVVKVDIETPFFFWTPFPTTPPGTYVLALDDASGQHAVSPQFFMLATGTKSNSTPALQFTIPPFSNVTTGTPLNCTWTGANGTATMTLWNGNATNVSMVATVVPNITDSYYVWTPAPSLPASQYVLQIEDSSGNKAYSSAFFLVVNGTVSASTGTGSITSIAPISAPSPILSGATKAGIAIGILVVLSLIGGMIFLYHRQQKLVALTEPASSSGSSIPVVVGGEEDEAMTPLELPMPHSNHMSMPPMYGEEDLEKPVVALGLAGSRISELDAAQIKVFEIGPGQ